MFKLTRLEQVVVAFVVGAALLGTLVRDWRTRQQSRTSAAAIIMETTDR